MNRDFLKMILSAKEKPSDYYDRKNKRYKKDVSEYFEKNDETYKEDTDILKSVKKIMKLSPMKKVEESENHIIYQHPDLPEFYMYFRRNGEVSSEIAPADFDSNKAFDSLTVKKEKVKVGTQKELYEAIDSISYVRNDDVLKASENRTKVSEELQDAITAFLEKNWL